MDWPSIEELASNLSDSSVDALEPNEKFESLRKGYRKDYLRRLSTDYYEIDASLDLHRKTIDEAKSLFIELYVYSLENKCRCLKIIHGKSVSAKDRRSTLKSLVISWLRQLNQVVAFCSAPPHQGGEGAVIVLLDFDNELPSPSYFDWD